jgi:hypothetical protein
LNNALLKIAEAPAIEEPLSVKNPTEKLDAVLVAPSSADTDMAVLLPMVVVLIVAKVIA